MRTHGLFRQALRLLPGLVLLVVLGACSDPKPAANLSAAGSGDGSGGTGVGKGDGSGNGSGDGEDGGDPGYLPLSTSLTGNWMHHEIGNCIDIEEWLGFILPDSFSRTLVDRNACGPHGVVKVVGNLQVLPGQVLRMEYQDKTAYHQWQRTSAIVQAYPHPSDGPTDAAYKPGKRALTVLAYVRTTGSGPFVRTDRHEIAAQSATVSHTIATTAVQLTVTPPPGNAKAGDACQMAVSLAASWDPGTNGGYVTATEPLTLPCHYSEDPATKWLRVAADGYEASTVDGSWGKLVDSKGWWKKYPNPLNQLLYDSFRPVLVQPPEQRAVLLSDASFGWYPEYLNDPPVSVK